MRRTLATSPKARNPLLPLLIALACLASGPALGDDSPAASAEVEAATAPPRKHELQLGWAPRYHTRKDELYSPLWQQGLSAEGIALRYSWNGERSAHRAAIGVAKSQIKAGPTWGYNDWPTGETKTTWPVYITHIQVAYAYLHKLPVPDVVTLRLGGAVDVDLQNIDWLIAGYGFGSYFGSITLDIKAELTVPVAERHSLTLDVGLPLLAWIARSPYSIHDETTIYNNRDANDFKTAFRYIGAGRLESWNSFQSLRAALTWRWQISDPMGLALTLHSRLTAEQHPRPLLATETGLTVAANWQF